MKNLSILIDTVCNYKSKFIRRLFSIIFLTLMLITASGCATLKALDLSDPSYPLPPSNRPLDDPENDCKKYPLNNKSEHNVELIVPEERKQISEEILVDNAESS